jgi:hypothetical protein
MDKNNTKNLVTGLDDDPTAELQILSHSLQMQDGDDELEADANTYNCEDDRDELDSKAGDGASLKRDILERDNPSLACNMTSNSCVRAGPGWTRKSRSAKSLLTTSMQSCEKRKMTWQPCKKRCVTVRRERSCWSPNWRTVPNQLKKAVS